MRYLRYPTNRLRSNPNKRRSPCLVSHEEAERISKMDYPQAITGRTILFSLSFWLLVAGIWYLAGASADRAHLFLLTLLVTFGWILWLSRDIDRRCAAWRAQQRNG